MAATLNRLRETAKLFIDQSHQSEPRMRAIVDELKMISGRVKKMHNENNKAKYTGYGLVAIGVGLFAGGAALDGGKMIRLLAISSPFLGILGYKCISEANSERSVTERDLMQTMQPFKDEFQNIIDLQKNSLEEIDHLLIELEESSLCLKTPAGVQAQNTLSEIESFVSLLEEMNGMAASDEAKCAARFVRQCEKNVEQLSKMRNNLRDFRD